MCFKSKILNILLACTPVTHYRNYCMFQNLLHFHGNDMWNKSMLDEFLYCNRFVLLLGPPVVEMIPPALSTLRGVPANFTCHAEGFPLPTIEWMKQNGSVESVISANNANFKINSHLGSSQLIVQNTSTADSGYFICKASNYVSDTARAFLGVVCKLYPNCSFALLITRVLVDDFTTLNPPFSQMGNFWFCWANVSAFRYCY